MKFSSDLLSELDSRDLTVIQANEVAGFLEKADEVSIISWPEFMRNDAVANKSWQPMHEIYPEFQFAMVDRTTEKWLVVGNSIPVCFEDDLENLPDAGWDWALLAGLESEGKANLQCALAIQILPEFRGRGLSTVAIKVMQEIGQYLGLERLIAPVRPNKKSDYPLTPMNLYIEWFKADRPFDPWLRVHHNMGARIIKVCPEAMTIAGSIQDWQEWTGLTFQTSGEYIIPGALSPVKMDVENDRGVYIEANVWMVHNDNCKAT